MMSPASDPWFWIVLILLAAAVALLLRARSRTAAAQRRARSADGAVADARRAADGAAAEAQRVAQERDAELGYFAQQVVPELAALLLRGQALPPSPTLRNAALQGTAFAAAEEQIAARMRELAEGFGERAEKAARSTVQMLTRAQQALVNEQQGEVQKMLERHADEAVLRDIQPIDHASSRLGRRAQIIGVLTGSWPGRQRTDSPLVDVVRGGVSRIRDYRRVVLNNDLDRAVVGQAVEPVVLAVAELLDNATVHSDPSSTVEVQFKAGYNGVAIMIDDAGIGLTPEAAEFAEKLLPGREPVKLTELRHPPKLGFAAVGTLAARYGFRVAVDDGSPYGGVRATLFLPNALLASTADTRPAAAAPPAAEPAVSAVSAAAAATAPLPPTAPESSPPPAGPASAPTAAEAEASPAYETRTDGLPQRRRHDGPPERSAEAPPMQRPSNARGAVAAFHRATPAEPTPAPPTSHSTQDSAAGSHPHGGPAAGEERTPGA